MKIYFFLILVLTNACSLKGSGRSEQSQIFFELEPTFFKELPDYCDESSGLELVNNVIFTMNDSGGKDELYLFNSSAGFYKKVQLKNAKNKDWEELAANNEYMFVGDFGNNNGNRKDLKVYAVSEWKGDKAKNKVINFKYKNQTDYREQSHSHSYDCEAMIAFDNELILFSKDWSNQTTEVYHLPINFEDEQVLVSTEKLDVGVLITGADYHEISKTLVLTGYMDNEMYLYVFEGSTQKKLLTDDYYKIKLTGLTNAQVEAVCFIDDSRILISTEKTKAFKQQLWRLSLP